MYIYFFTFWRTWPNSSKLAVLFTVSRMKTGIHAKLTVCFPVVMLDIFLHLATLSAPYLATLQQLPTSSTKSRSHGEQLSITTP